MKPITPKILALTLALVTILGLTFAFAATKTVAISKANFPDATFRKYVKQFDENKNGKLEASELRKVDNIDLEDMSAIKNLKGIEYFTYLWNLDCSGTSIKSLDVRKNRKLCLLTAVDAPLTSIQLGRKDDLDDLNLSGTKLAGVDISGCSRQLEAVTDPNWPYTVSKGVIYWDGSDAPLTINITTKVMNIKKVLFTCARPKTFKFTKASVTLKRGAFDSLWRLLNRTPANSVYKTTFTCDKKGIIDLDKHTGYAEALKKGTVTVTATSGDKKATIKLTVK